MQERGYVQILQFGSDYESIYDTFDTFIAGQVRGYVPVAAWFNATSPHRMAEAVQYYAAMGHTWMKFHLSPFENVIEQTRAMQVSNLDFSSHTV